MLDLKIAKPCSQSWTAMKGDERVRHCGACRKNVYNIAEMTEEEVEELIRRTEGHFCARIYRRTDQRVMTADCPKGVATVKRKRTLAVTAAFGVVASGLWPLVVPQRTMGAVRIRRATPLANSAEMGDLIPQPEPFMGFISGRSDTVNVELGKIAVIPKRTSHPIP